MEPENNNQNLDQSEEVTGTNQLHKITPFSKYLAMVLFIILPFVGGWIGYQYVPEKVMEVERVVMQEVEVRENLFERHDFSRDTLTLIEAPELYKDGTNIGWSTSYHIFHDYTHAISIPGDCKILPTEFSGFRKGLKFEEQDDYEVLSHVVCNKHSSWSGTETLLLGKKDPPAGPQRLIIHYNYQDCAMSSDSCESYGSPIQLRNRAYSSR